MITIIAGGRDITDSSLLDKAIERCGWKISRVVCGTSRGADTLGEYWAIDNNVPIDMFPANWNKFGKAAGKIRNTEMAENAEALIALWDGISKGTGHMIDTARRKGLEVFVQFTEDYV